MSEIYTYTNIYNVNTSTGSSGKIENPYGTSAYPSYFHENTIYRESVVSKELNPFLSLVNKELESMTERERKLIQEKLDYLISNNKIKLKIEINDEEKI